MKVQAQERPSDWRSQTCLTVVFEPRNRSHRWVLAWRRGHPRPGLFPGVLRDRQLHRRRQARSHRPVGHVQRHRPAGAGARGAAVRPERHADRPDRARGSAPGRGPSGSSRPSRRPETTAAAWPSAAGPLAPVIRGTARPPDVLDRQAPPIIRSGSSAGNLASGPRRLGGHRAVRQRRQRHSQRLLPRRRPAPTVERADGLRVPPGPFARRPRPGRNVVRSTGRDDPAVSAGLGRPGHRRKMPLGATQSAFEIIDYTLMIRLVRAGFGTTLVPASAMQGERGRGPCAPSRSTTPPMRWNLSAAVSAAPPADRRHEDPPRRAHPGQPVTVGRAARLVTESCSLCDWLRY